MNIFGYEIGVRKTDTMFPPVVMNPEIEVDDIEEKALDQQKIGTRIIDVSSSYWERSASILGVSHRDYMQLLRMYTSWVYVCAMKNSQTVAKHKFKLYARKRKLNTKILWDNRPVEKSLIKLWDTQPHMEKFLQGMEDVVEITEHPMLDLLQKVNPTMNRFDLLELHQTFQELTGNTYWYIVPNALGLPEQIWLVRPQYMRVILKTKGEEANDGEIIKGYAYRESTTIEVFDPTEIIHFKMPSPHTMVYGQGPLSAALKSVQFDNSSRDFEINLMENRGMPDGVLRTTESIKEAEFDRIRLDWRKTQLKKKLGSIVVLDKGLEYQQLTVPPRDMNFIIGRKITKEEIAGVFGVPLSKLTTEDVNRSNSDVGEIQYLRDTIEPRCRRFEEKINEQLTPRYDDNLFISYGEIVPTDRAFRLTEITSHLGCGYSSVNEERKIDGKDPVEWGDKPILSSTMAVFTGKEAPQPPAPGNEPGNQPSNNPLASPEKPNKSKNPPKGTEAIPSSKQPGKRPVEMNNQRIKDITSRVMEGLKRKGVI